MFEHGSGADHIVGARFAKAGLAVFIGKADGVIRDLR